MMSHHPGGEHSTLIRLIRRQFITVVILALVALGIIAGAQGLIKKQASGSPEVQFTDASKSGLAIVPASCPSSPHYRGECDVPCVSSANSYASCTCPTGYSPGRPTIQTGNSACIFTGCPSGYVLSGIECLPDLHCPTGYVQQGNQCVFVACPLGYTRQGNQCVFTGCPAGYTVQNGQCVATGSCSPQFFCQGSDLYQNVRRSLGSSDGTGGSCSAHLYQHCTYGCSGSACLGAPPPSIVTWNVHPVLVQKNTTVRVTWAAQNVDSCTVTGTNGDGKGVNATGVWNTTSGDKVSTPIVQQTIYTITCNGFAGANPATVTQSTTVNLVPEFQEQ